MYIDSNFEFHFKRYWESGIALEYWESEIALGYCESGVIARHEGIIDTWCLPLLALMTGAGRASDNGSVGLQDRPTCEYIMHITILYQFHSDSIRYSTFLYFT